VQSSLFFTETLETQLNLYAQHFGKRLRLHLHPFVAAYIKQGGIGSLSLKWWWKYKVKIVPNQSLGVLQYQFFDKDAHRLELPDDEDALSENQ
jgi:ribonuclease G